MTTSAKQKPNVAVRLSDELEKYLRDQAKTAHRTLTAEIRMRLEASRHADPRQTHLPHRHQEKGPAA